MRVRSLFILFGGLSLLLSCTVLEDREGCPCRLRFDVRKSCGLSGEQATRVYVAEESGRTQEHDALLADFRNLRTGTTVRRGLIRAGGWIGSATHSRLRGNRLMIEEGAPGDSLYWISGTVDADAETAVLPLRIRKEHVRLALSFVLDDSGRFPFDLTVRSTTAGIDLIDGTPVPGHFRCHLEEESPGCFRTILPRQYAPEDLRIEVRSKDGTGDVSYLPLHSYITACTYFSWLDEDLRDLEIEINYIIGTVTVRVEDWIVVETLTLNL